MEEYSQRIDLYAGEDFIVFQASSKLYKKEVVVKEYQRSDVYSSEGLVKEAIRQAREKPKETAVLIGISLEPREGASESACTVSYTLEKKAQDVERSLIIRNDGGSQWALVGLDGYKVSSTVYAVGRKRVEIAFSTHLGKEVAIKSKKCFKANEANELLREAFLLAYVEHRHVCKLIDICFTREAKSSFRINIIMEKLETVESDMENRDYQESELLKFLQDVTRGLAYMKTLNVAHCDIKPSNIFIDENRDYKLGDLGSAWKKSLRTETSIAAGTVYYMSPDMRLCLSNPMFRVNSHLADVYSLGITVMHMAAQKLPILNDPIKPEEVINLSEELLNHMAAVDPDLRAYRSEGRIRQKVIEMLAANHLFGVRLNIMKSAQETIRNIPYSEDLKQLFQDMVEVDPRLRIHLEDLIERVDYILTRSALLPETAIQPASAISPQARTQGTLFRLAFGEGRKIDGRLQVFDIDSRAWARPQRPTLDMEVDYATCYAFATETAVVLCGSHKQPGTSAYRVEFAGSPPTVTALPRFPERRVLAGIYAYEEGVLAFGGSSYVVDDDYYYSYDYSYAYSYYYYSYYSYDSSYAYFVGKEDALSLSLSALREWQSISGRMSEKKVATTPCRLELKLYICQQQIDVFNLQSSAFEQPLALQLPAETYLSKVAFFSSNNELVVISSRYTFRIDITQPRMTQEEHKPRLIDPTSPVVIKGDSAFWISLASCKTATIKAPFELSTFS